MIVESLLNKRVLGVRARVRVKVRVEILCFGGLRVTRFELGFVS